MNLQAQNNQAHLISRIIFPFYRISSHKFLLTKWWFRGLLVLYALLFLIIVSIAWMDVYPVLEVVLALMFHYLVQLFFFKIIVDFVVLNTK